MTLGFVIAPASKIREAGQYDDFRSILADLQQNALAKASTVWKGYSFGGLRPEGQQFGITTFRPRDVMTPGGQTNTGGGTATFVKTYGSQGSWTDIYSYSVPENEIHAWAGVGIPDASLIFSQMRFEISDRRFPIIDIEEAHMFPGGFALMFKQDKGEEFIAVENDRVLLRGRQERGTRGRQQRVIPLGFQLYKNKDLHIVERDTVG